jgi:methionyl-tRNA synthetase
MYADDLVNFFGVDAVRYYVLSAMPQDNDGLISWESVIETINSDLANVYGNLVSRTVAMSNKYFGGVVENTNCSEELDGELISLATSLYAKVKAKMEDFKVSDALFEIMTLFRRANKYIDETMPWALAKDESKKARLEAVMYNLLENIRLLSVLLEPIMPKCAKEIRNQLCTDNKELKVCAAENFAVGTPSPLFSRLDADKVIEELTKEMEEKMKAAKAENDAVNTVSLAQIGIEDFMKVELKTAKILECEPVKKAKKLLKLTLDDGSGTPRTVASGIAKWYKPEDLIGHTIILVSNLKPAVLCGVESQGMILAADVAEDDVRVIFADDIPKGSKIR